MLEGYGIGCMVGRRALLVPEINQHAYCERSRGRGMACKHECYAARARRGRGALRAGGAVNDLGVWWGCRLFLKVLLLRRSVSSAPDNIVALPGPGHAGARSGRARCHRTVRGVCGVGCERDSAGRTAPRLEQGARIARSRPRRASKRRATRRTRRGVPSRRPPRAPARPRAIAPGERGPIDFPFLDFRS